MLRLLDIENIAIIEKLSAEFSPGLNILSGETGAGKSILIDSINAVTGEKTPRDLIRTGESSAFVSAVFDSVSQTVSSKLSDMGITTEADGSLLLQRKLTRDGKNICRINGTVVTVSQLKDIGIELINIHGQRDSQALLNPERHLSFLDAFGGLESVYSDYLKDYCVLKEKRARIKKLSMDEQLKERRIDLLTYQINELTNAAIVPGERQELRKKKNILNNSKKLSASLTNALNLLSGYAGSPGAAEMIKEACSEIYASAPSVKGLETVAASLESGLDTIFDASGVLDDLLRQLSDVSGDPDKIDERLDLLYRLSKKYGDTEEEMLDFLKNASDELEQINLSDEEIKNLTAQCETLEQTCLKKAALLAAKRKKAAAEFSKAAERELKDLDMPNCRFFVRFTQIPLSEKGTEDAEFLIAANPGEEPKPLSKTASGGELSRIMLGIKNILSETESVGTLIFDEIDTGVSGSAANKIAQKLANISSRSQVICITHQPQIAAKAEEHLFLYKEVISGKTYTKIKTLDRDGRINAIAEMTFGPSPTREQLLSAEQMLT